MNDIRRKNSDEVRAVLESAATRMGRTMMGFGGFVVVFGVFMGVVASKDTSINGNMAYLVLMIMCVLVMASFGGLLLYSGKTKPKQARAVLEAVETQPDLVTEAHFTRIQSKAAPGEMGAVYNLQLTVEGKNHVYSIKHQHVDLISEWMRSHIPHALS